MGDDARYGLLEEFARQNLSRSDVAKRAPVNVDKCLLLPLADHCQSVKAFVIGGGKATNVLRRS